MTGFNVIFYVVLIIGLMIGLLVGIIAGYTVGVKSVCSINTGLIDEDFLSVPFLSDDMSVGMAKSLYFTYKPLSEEIVKAKLSEVIVCS
jgi:ABC-type antimicrobial peptide transport system permease subunit